MSPPTTATYCCCTVKQQPAKNASTQQGKEKLLQEGGRQECSTVGPHRVPSSFPHSTFTKKKKSKGPRRSISEGLFVHNTYSSTLAFPPGKRDYLHHSFVSPPSLLRSVSALISQKGVPV